MANRRKVVKRRGVIGLAVFAIEWPARVVVHYPQYIWNLRARESHRHLLLRVRRGERAVSREEPRGDPRAARAVREMIEQVILIAAGRGKRLGAYTQEIPKCMVEVAGRPIFGWVWKALARSV